MTSVTDQSVCYQILVATINECFKQGCVEFINEEEPDRAPTLVIHTVEDPQLGEVTKFNFTRAGAHFYALLHSDDIEVRVVVIAEAPESMGCSAAAVGSFMQNNQGVEAKYGQLSLCCDLLVNEDAVPQLSAMKEEPLGYSLLRQ